MRRVLLVAALAVALAVVGTWPLAARLSTHVYDPTAEAHGLSSLLLSDVYLTLWILAWDAHALGTHARALFDANIFHPAHDTLALSEHMLGAMPVYLPLVAVSRDPVAAHQATLVLSFAFAFLAAFALVRDWTASWPAAVSAGILFAFSGFRAGTLAALHMEGNYYLPLVPLLAHRAVRDPRLRWAVLLGIVLTLQALHSYYLAYAMFAGLAALLAVVFLADERARRCWPRLIIPTVAAALVVTIVTAPYLRAAARGALLAPAAELVSFSSGAVGRTGATGALLVCVLTGCFWRHGLKTHVSHAWPLGLLSAALVTHLLALGPEVRVAGWTLPAPFALLAALVPGVESVRVPVRFNAATTMCLAALAGVGLAGALHRLEARRAGGRVTRWLPGASAVGLALLSVPLTMRWPVATTPIATDDHVPAVYRALASAAPGPLLELPFHDVALQPFERLEEARRAYLSVYHWHPLLNGYSGYVPASYRIVSGLVRALPDAEALRLLGRTTGVRYVVIHGDQLPPSLRADWPARVAALGTSRSFGQDVLVTLPDPHPDLLPRLVSPAAGAATLVGTPLVAVPEGERRAQLRIVGSPPRAVFAGIAFGMTVEVTNLGSATWPVLSTETAHVVELAYRWQDPTGRRLSTGASPLPYDLGPSASIVTTLTVAPPAASGAAVLSLGVAQDGEWFAGGPAPITIGVERPGTDSGGGT
jgi:hypothetical protein